MISVNIIDQTPKSIVLAKKHQLEAGIFNINQ